MVIGVSGRNGDVVVSYVDLGFSVGFEYVIILYLVMVVSFVWDVMLNYSCVMLIFV